MRQTDTEADVPMLPSFDEVGDDRGEARGAGEGRLIRTKKRWTAAADMGNVQSE